MVNNAINNIQNDNNSQCVLSDRSLQENNISNIIIRCGNDFIINQTNDSTSTTNLDCNIKAVNVNDLKTKILNEAKSKLDSNAEGLFAFSTSIDASRTYYNNNIKTLIENTNNFKCESDSSKTQINRFNNSDICVNGNININQKNKFPNILTLL